MKIILLDPVRFRSDWWACLVLYILNFVCGGTSELLEVMLSIMNIVAFFMLFVLWLLYRRSWFLNPGAPSCGFIRFIVDKLGTVGAFWWRLFQVEPVLVPLPVPRPLDDGLCELWTMTCVVLASALPVCSSGDGAGTGGRGRPNKICNGVMQDQTWKSPASTIHHITELSTSPMLCSSVPILDGTQVYRISDVLCN